MVTRLELLFKIYNSSSQRLYPFLQVGENLWPRANKKLAEASFREASHNPTLNLLGLDRLVEITIDQGR